MLLDPHPAEVRPFISKSSQSVLSLVQFLLTEGLRCSGLHADHTLLGELTHDRLGSHGRHSPLVSLVED